MDVGSLLPAIWKLNALQLAVGLYNTIWLAQVLFSGGIVHGIYSRSQLKMNAAACVKLTF